LRLDPGELEANRKRDLDFFEGLAHTWKERGWLRDDVQPRAVFDLVAAMFALSLQTEVIGPDTVHRAVHEIATAIAARWTP